MTGHILDIQIRRVLTSQIREQDPIAVIVDELPLCKRLGRADIAAVNGVMSGYEIKSERDKLTRLPSQVSMYEAVFDYCYVVVAPVHLKRVRETIPRSWGIALAENTESLRIQFVRQAKINRQTDVNALIRLMWKPEIVRTLLANGSPASINEPIRNLWERMLIIPKAEIARAARESLKTREGSATASAQRIQCDG